MPRLQLHLLGPPQVERDGATCDLHSHKALALLAYLAVTNQPHSRAKLATIFWPDQNESRALAYLRHTLWSLRKALGDDLLEGEQEQVCIQPSVDLWVDVRRFEADLTASHLQQAVECYRDDFLAGFTLRDSPAFDEWQFFERERLRQSFATALQQLVNQYQTQADYEAAIAYARRWLALDPLHEPAHQQLIKLYAWSNQKAAAVRQYRECRRILRQELDVEPDPATQSLYQQVQNGGKPPPPPLTALSAPAHVASPSTPAKPPAASVDRGSDPSSDGGSDEDALRFVTALCVGLSIRPEATDITDITDITNITEITEIDEGVFADLHLAEVSPTQFSKLLQVVEEAVAPYQARVERMLGGTMLALFGVQRVHEDDGERALSAALAMQQAAATLQLPITLGISVGLVYIGSFPIGSPPISSSPSEATANRAAVASAFSKPLGVVLGSVINLAAYLQAHAEPGLALVSKTVYRQTRGAFRFQAYPLRLSGASPSTTAYQLLGRQATPRKARGIEGLQAQLVGRREELERLHRLAVSLNGGESEGESGEASEKESAGERQGSGQLVAVIGEAGVGKSRLLLEFRSQLPRLAAGWLWLEGRCQEKAQEAGYAPFIDLLHAFWHWRPEESETVRAASIRSLLTDLCEDQHLQPAAVAEIAALLGRLFALHFGNEWDRLLHFVDVQEVRRRTANALCDLFVALADRQPVILVLEDLHWADTLSLDLINLLMTRLADAPILLICVYRPEQSRRAWQLANRAGQKCPGRFCQLDLQPLTPQQSRLMLVGLLGPSFHMSARSDGSGASDPGGSTLPPALQNLILEKAQGNPLFLEELIYALIDSGLLVLQGAGWRVASQIRLTHVPDTLQSIIFTRLDYLGSPWKEILQHAAVIGRTFRRRLLVELIPPVWDLEEALQHLCDAAFLYQERLYPEEEYSFRHVLVQEAIYHALLQRQRRQLHRKIAAQIEQLAGTRVQDQIHLLAYHWCQAGEPSKAIHYLLLAGDKAQGSLAYEEAATYYRRAVGFLKEQGDIVQSARVLMKLGNSYHSAGEYRRARQAFDEGFALQQQMARSPIPEDKLLPAAPFDPQPPILHTLRMAWGEPASIDPIHTDNTSSMALVQHLFSPLVSMRPTFEILPAVAERWQVLQGGRRYLFHLRPDVQWSDGTAVTAHDYALTLRRILATNSDDSMASLFFAIKNAQAYHSGQISDLSRLGITVLDAHSLQIDLEQPASYFLQSLTCAAAYPTPRHLFAQHGEAWSTPEIVVSNGPFRLADWQPGQSMRLVRNSAFFGQRAGQRMGDSMGDSMRDSVGDSVGNVDQVELQFALTTAQQSDAYANGELDALWLNDFNPSERQPLRQRYADHYHSSPLLNVIFAAFDASQPPFAECRVRQAFVHALEREALVNTALGGYEQPALGGFVPIGLPGHSPQIGLSFDPQQARRRLEEAGSSDHAALAAITAYAWHGTEAVCHALTQQWQQHLGVTVAWQFFDHADFVYRRFQDHPALSLFGWTCDYPDASIFLDLFVNTEITHWHNADFLRLFEQAQRSLEPTERLALLAQADQIAIAEAAVLPLYYERLQFLLHPRIKRYPLAPFRWWFWQDVVLG